MNHKQPLMWDSNLSCWNSPGIGDETVNGVFRIANFDILLGFFNAHVNPYEPTRNPFKEIQEEH